MVPQAWLYRRGPRAGQPPALGSVRRTPVLPLRETHRPLSWRPALGRGRVGLPDVRATLAPRLAPAPEVGKGHAPVPARGTARHRALSGEWPGDAAATMGTGYRP